MGRRSAIAGIAALGMVAVVSPPAAAQHPGEDGLISWVHDTDFEGVPCVGGIDDDTPLSLPAWAGIAWSADGTEVALDTEIGIFVVTIADCSLRDLGPEGGGGLSWSPDGSQIAAVHGGDIVLVSSQTGRVEQVLTSTPEVEEAHPSWSPAGDVVAFTGEDGVRVAPVDGTLPGGTLVVPGASFPDFSPDGERLVYTVDRLGDAEPLLAHASAVDGGDEVVLPERIRAYHVSWSPDGQRLLFSGKVDDDGDFGGTPACYVTSLDGSVVEDLDLTGPNPCALPTWQPMPVEMVPDLTLVYLYRKVDPTRRASWGNSGTQHLVSVSTGHTWGRTLQLADLPPEVCGDGWGVQTDHTVGLIRSQVPAWIDRATWTNVLGWGTVVTAARHHSLQYHLDEPIPPCEDPAAG